MFVASLSVQAPELTFTKFTPNIYFCLNMGTRNVFWKSLNLAGFCQKPLQNQSKMASSILIKTLSKMGPGVLYDCIRPIPQKCTHLHVCHTTITVVVSL